MYFCSINSVYSEGNVTDSVKGRGGGGIGEGREGERQQGQSEKEGNTRRLHAWQTYMYMYMYMNMYHSTSGQLKGAFLATPKVTNVAPS